LLYIKLLLPQLNAMSLFRIAINLSKKY